MTPRNWLLLLLALRDAERPLDPVRLQKGLFLLAEEADLPKAEAYEFEPYDYGPFSAEIYADLEQLLEGGMSRGIDVPGYNWNRYLVTAKGVGHAQTLVDQFDEHHLGVLRQLADIKDELLDLSFDALLRRVYDRHPKYAVNSVFR